MGSSGLEWDETDVANFLSMVASLGAFNNAACNSVRLPPNQIILKVITFFLVVGDSMILLIAGLKERC